jgi:hypothetical protein
MVDFGVALVLIGLGSILIAIAFGIVYSIIN